MKTVVQSWQCLVINPRGKIYSCLGLVDAYFNESFGDYVPTGLLVDYNASVEDVYSSFVRALSSATKRLDILAFYRGKHTKHIRHT
jgi:hypothetical protein